MKRIVLILVAVALPVFLMAQNSAVDNLFDKYKGKEGVTTVQISPELFQIVKAMQIEEIDEHDIPFDKIASVKILTIEDEDGWDGVNFYKEIQKDLNVSDFAEVLTVDDGGETVRIWMKADNALVSEFLLIVGGDDNVLIYITGNFNLNDLDGLAESFDQHIDL
ncbi:MAG: DUF4252 domain-containing protein [Bacteroidales bacterium]|nr:DUF4252 domain-containing protein [Bacteroidales bacterium]